jgi:lipoate-protein ligase A
LNISVVLPLRGPHYLSIEAGYLLWIAVLGSALREAFGVPVDVGPVNGAFCSGRFDVAVAGRKLAGIAQARRNGSVLIHGTVLVDVDRVEYLQIVAAADSAVGVTNTHPYCEDRIVSLHELVGRSLRVAEVADAILRVAGPTRPGVAISGAA